MKIGFIGLGNMGAPMAVNLAAAGHDVVGFDVAAPCPDTITQAVSAMGAAKDAQVVITMLPNGDILRRAAGHGRDDLCGDAAQDVAIGQHGNDELCIFCRANS